MPDLLRDERVTRLRACGQLASEPTYVLLVNDSADVDGRPGLAEPGEDAFSFWPVLVGDVCEADADGVMAKQDRFDLRDELLHVACNHDRQARPHDHLEKWRCSRFGGTGPYPRIVQPDDQPVPVFVFYEDGSGVDAYESLRAAWRAVEGIDVKNGEYIFIAADGRGVEATVSEKWDVTLRLTAESRTDDLRDRLALVLPVVGLDGRLANTPMAATQALVDARWSVRWPRWPSWLDRRLHGHRPVLASE